jgi:serine/threonine protein kinase
MTRQALIGTLISRYRVSRLLGEGGMGAVYLAVDESLGRQVAIKLLRPDFARNPEAVQRLFNEARAVNLIAHPGLVQISEFGQLADGSAFLVMEYLNGETLTERVMRGGGRLREADATQIAGQLASVLAAAHAKGVIHRDLKPRSVAPEAAPRAAVPRPAVPVV